MNNTKKLAISTILLAAASLFSIGNLANRQPAADNNDGNNKNNKIILYYGSACPHCKIVEEYLARNKIAIAQKEVYQNQENKNDLLKIAKICGIGPNELGVPLLWEAAESKCYSGDQAIIDFLKTKFLP